MSTCLSMAMPPTGASFWSIIGYMFLLIIVNSVAQKSTWFPHHDIQNFPLGRVFHVFGEHVHLPVNGYATYACQLLVYHWVHISLGFCQLCWPEISLDPPSLYAKPPPGASFSCLGRMYPPLVNGYPTYACQLLIYH